MKDLKQKFGNFFKHWPLISIFLVTLVFFYPVIFHNKIPLPADALVGAHVPWTEISWQKYPAGVPIKNQEITDAFSQFYPWRALAGEFWRAGKAPLWNPYMFSGTPFLATWHSASIYPFNSLYLVLSDVNAWTGLIFLQIFLAGAFMYLFLRELQLNELGSLLGAFAFTFSGYMIAWLEFATGGHAGLWLPLLFLFELRMIKTKKNLWLFLIPVVFFFIYTAGDFQVPFYITATYLMFGAYLSFKSKDVRKNLVKIFLGLFLGILLSSLQLIPTLELFSQSVRVDDPYIREYYFGIMHWEKIVNFLWPDFFGNVVTRNYWGKFGYHEYLSFVGATSLVFAVFSFFKKRLEKENFFWAVLLVSLLFLFPTPLAFLPYELRVPGLGTSSASRLIYIVDFCLATLAAYGFTKWMKGEKGLIKVFTYFLAITFGVGLGIFISLRGLNDPSLANPPELVANLRVALRNMVPSTLVLLAGASILVGSKTVKKFKFKRIYVLRRFVPVFLLLMAIAELLRFGWKNTPFSPREFVFPKTQIIDFLQGQEQPFRIAGGIPLNLFMPFAISSAEGYDPIYPKINSEWYSLVNAGNLSALSGRYGLIHRFDSHLLDYANVKYVVDYKKNIYGGISESGSFYTGVSFPRYEEVFSEGRIKVFENNNVLPRVFVTENFEVVKEKDELIEKLTAKASEERLILLEKEPRLALSEEITYSVDNFTYDYNKITFDVETSGNGLLFLSETYFPGWKVYINGLETEIFRANYIYQTIPLSEGEHFIEFIYSPKSFRIGVILSVTVAILLTVAYFYESRFKKSS